MESDDEDMFVDNLSDVSKDSDNIEDSDRDVLSSDSERDDGVEDESDKEDVDVWTEIDHAPNLEPFLGKSQINTMPNDPSSICEVVSLFFGDDLFQFMVDETNRYRLQNRDKMRDNKNSLQWKNINIMELKHFIGLILIMGLVRKDSRDDYWSTDPTIETPVFSKVMSRSRFRQIWRTWHFCNNENMNETSERLFKISPILDYFVSKFNTVYKPQQELSLDESIIPWRRGLFSKVYNAGKLIKYGLLVTTVCEASSGYICNLEICTTKGTKLIDTILSVTSPFHNLWHHIYMDNYYNNVEMGKVLLSHKIRICGTIRANRELPISLKNVQLSRGGTTFRRNNDILLQIWRPKRIVRIISTIHSARLIESHNKERKTRNNIYKPEAVIDYDKYMKGVDRADQYLTYYSILRRTKKWTKRAVMYLINCAFFNAFRLYSTLNTKKIYYKAFLHEIARQWIAASKQSIENFDDEMPAPSTTCKRTSLYDHPLRLSMDMRKHKIVKIAGVGKSITQRLCKVCTANKKKKRTCFMCQFCKVSLHKGNL